MTPKEYLSQALTINLELKTLQSDYEDIKATMLTVSKYQNDPISKTRRNSSEDKMMKLLDYWEKINKALDLKIDTKMKLADEISNVEDTILRQLLYMRYISLMNWEDISEEMNYGLRHVYKLHSEALKCFEESNPDVFK